MSGGESQKVLWDNGLVDNHELPCYKTTMRLTTAKAIGSRLKRFCKSKASYAILDKSKGSGGTWTAGGCLILAKAVYENLKAEGFHNAKIKILHGNGSPQHALVSVCLDDMEEVYLDADGFSTKEELFERWQNDECVAQPIRVRFLPYFPDCMPQPGVEQFRLLKEIARCIT